MTKLKLSDLKNVIEEDLPYSVIEIGRAHV